MDVWIAGIDPSAVAETDGIAYTIYFSGCSIRCPGCHNKELWDREAGQLMDTDCIIKDIKRHLELVDTVCILGGEPTDQLEALKDLLYKLQDLPVEVWLYTGLEFEEIQKILEVCYCDVIKCGRYIKESSSPGSRLASDNQYFVYIKR